MSRTRHVTSVRLFGDWRSLDLGECVVVDPPHRTRAPSRLTRPKLGEFYLPNTDRPRNNGAWSGGFAGNAGQRRRKRARVDKILGRRLERRRRNRMEAV